MRWNCRHSLRKQRFGSVSNCSILINSLESVEASRPEIQHGQRFWSFAFLWKSPQAETLSGVRWIDLESACKPLGTNTSAINIAIRKKLSIQISSEIMVFKGPTASIRIIVGT
jgi:hypothetical protein